jgi:hypothetical protein
MKVVDMAPQLRGRTDFGNAGYLDVWVGHCQLLTRICFV